MCRVFSYLSDRCKMCYLVYTYPLNPSTGNVLLGKKTCKIFTTLKLYTAFRVQEEWNVKFEYGHQHLDLELGDQY